MFVLVNSLKNLYRYRLRYLIAFTGIVGILGLFIYGVVYYPIIRDYNAEVNEYYMSRVEFRFRDELQYRQNRGKDDTVNNYVDQSENFNADGSMDEYDYDLTVSREYFEQFARSPYIAEMNLAYGCRVYAQMRSSYGLETSRKGLILYGGSLETLNLYLNEIMYRDFPRELELVEGREVRPDAAECMLYREMAEFNGLQIGDTIALHDRDDEKLSELKIVGLVECFVNYGNHRIKEDTNVLGYRIGSMPYRRLATTTLYHVFTDFDTAYGMYGNESDPVFDENHTFNNYIPMYSLASSSAYEAFTNELSEYSYDSNLHFYPLSRACTTYLREYDEKAAVLTIGIAGGLSLAVVIGLMIILIKERRDEMILLNALGIAKRKIAIGLMIEFGIFIAISAFWACVLSASADSIFNWFDLFYFDPLFQFRLTGEASRLLIGSGVILVMVAAAVCGISIGNFEVRG